MREVWRILFCFVIAFLGACSVAIPPKICNIYSNKVTHSYVIYIETSFNKDYYNKIIKAIATWRMALNPIVSFTIRSTNYSEYDILNNRIKEDYGSYSIFIVNSDGHSKFIPSSWVGYNNQDAYQVNIIGLITSRIKIDELNNVSLHELGHAIGLSHSNNIHSVMHPYATLNNNCPIREDVENICVNWCCNPAKLSYCKENISR